MKKIILISCIREKKKGGGVDINIRGRRSVIRLYQDGLVQDYSLSFSPKS